MSLDDRQMTGTLFERDEVLCQKFRSVGKAQKNRSFGEIPKVMLLKTLTVLESHKWRCLLEMLNPPWRF